MANRENRYETRPVTAEMPVSGRVSVPQVGPDSDPTEEAEFKAMMEFQELAAKASNIALRGRRALPAGW